MPRKVTEQQLLKHETPQEETFREDTFTEDTRESRIVNISERSRTGKKGKRSVEDMMASYSDPMMQAVYAMERIAVAEDMIAKVLSLAMPDAVEAILKRRPSLRRYVETKG